jgi:uncharacterized protein
MKKAKIYSLIIVPEAGQYMVTLEEIEGTRLIPIWIGPAEGMAIAAAIQKSSFPRPLTHDLICNMLNTIKVDVEKIVITDLIDGTFFAKIFMSQEKNNYSIDARPSDSLAIALRLNKPILVTDEVFKKCPVIEKPITDKEVKDFKERLKTLRPEDFFKEEK